MAQEQEPIDLDETSLDQDGESAGGDTGHLKPKYTNNFVGEEEEPDEG